MSEPSLKRLLALDKSFDTFKLRVMEAARILDIHIPSHSDMGKVFDDGGSIKFSFGEKHTGNFGRYTYVLRWIFDKFKKEKDARTEEVAWELATTIVRALPGSEVARVLQPTTCMSITIQALEDVFPDDGLETVFKYRAAVSGGLEISADSKVPRTGHREKKRTISEAEDEAMT